MAAGNMYIRTWKAFIISTVAVVGCRSDKRKPTTIESAPLARVDSLFPRITVGPNVHITKERADRLPTELGTCADPTNPNELAATVMFRNDKDFSEKVGVWVSHDRGKTWTLSFDNPNYSIDPSCAYGPEGRLYALNMAAPSAYEDYGIVLHSTGDGGKTWTSTPNPAASGWWIDRPWVTVDNTSGPNRGTVYLDAIHYRYAANASKYDGSSEYTEQLFFRSTDKGKTLQRTTIAGTGNALDPSDFTGTYHYTGQVGVLSNGTVVSTIQGPNALRRVALSTDGGRTFPSLITIAGLDANDKPAKHDRLMGHTMPMLAVDQSDGPYRDRVYVVWTDGWTGRNQIWLAYSLDREARVWAPARVIDDATANSLDSLKNGPHSTNVAVAVNKNGVVGISWADRRGFTGLKYQTRFMASHDGGETWSASVPVADRAAENRPVGRVWSLGNMTRSVGSRPLYMDFIPSATHREPGQFWGMSADAAGAFHPVWLDDKTGIPQAWTAMVEVDGKARKLEDITERVRVRVENTKFDSVGRRLGVDLKLLNISGQPISGPFLVKWIDPAERGSRSVASRDANSIPLNADNGWQGVGAVWVIDGGPVAPNAMTKPRRIEYRLRDVSTGSGVCCKDGMMFRVFTLIR
jgi:hypothetical protein